MSIESAGDLLGAKGPFSYGLPGFMPRAAQQEMADAVQQALGQRSTLIVEAGTGTGKTYAYLTPALLSRGRVVVSTGTKNLQDQLFFRDLPRVRDTLALPARVSLLKGRNNYLCLYRLRKAQLDPRGRVRRDRLQKVDEWAHRTDNGEISELGSIAADDPLLPAITSTADNCLGAKCPDFAECHVVKARRAAQAADLVVVNHHLLFSDFRLKQEGFGVLPGADAVIVDEAHQLPELAAQFFGERVSTRQLLDLVRDCGVEIQEFRDMPELTEAVDALAIAASELERPFLELAGRVAWRQFGNQPGAASALGAARSALGECADELKRYAERGAGLESCAQRAAGLVKRLEQIAAPEQAPENAAELVRWVEPQGRGGALHAAPVEPTAAGYVGRASVPSVCQVSAAALTTIASRSRP